MMCSWRIERMEELKFVMCPLVMVHVAHHVTLRCIHQYCFLVFHLISGIVSLTFFVSRSVERFATVITFLPTLLRSAHMIVVVDDVRSTIFMTYILDAK